MATKEITRYLVVESPIHNQEVLLAVTATANGVSHQAVKVFGDKLVVVDKAYIKKVIDNNKNFWSLCLNEVQQYITHHNLTGDYSI